MSKEEDKEDEDWSNYASAGYGSAYDPWADLVPLEEEEEEVDDYDLELDEIMVSSPPPSDDGLDNLVRLGACNYCIARLSGKLFIPGE